MSTGQEYPCYSDVTDSRQAERDSDADTGIN